MASGCRLQTHVNPRDTCKRMSSPSSSSSSLNPPLRCFSNLEGDDFSGWYAITNPFSCNDFCFWSFNNQTSDPHQSTTHVDNNASLWLCAYNAAMDDRRWNVVLAESIPFNKDKFEYLRCSRGPLENINPFTQRIITSKGTWVSLVTTALILSILEISILIYLIHRRKRVSRVRLSPTDTTRSSVTSIQYSTLPGTPSSQPPSRPFPLTWSILCAFGILIITILIFSLSSMSLYELQSTYDFTDPNLALLTPSCVSPWKGCLLGNQDMNRESTSFHSTLQNDTSFSYMIASDAQLYWYDGESPFTTNWPLPLPCNQQDSCSTCTKKVATYTNSQMKKAMERLISSSPSSSPINTSVWIRPKTLVMNGDLTSYYHPIEKNSFESFYHQIDPLEQYFPALGNHDYDHYEGASYHGDEWFSPHDCNAVHAIRYLKSGFCPGGIPKFDASHRLTRYDSKSLAYSWEEMNYHFVHLHYYPSYENARLGISSSLEWLERDLTLASQKNLTSILFVHAVEGFPTIMSKMLLDKKVAAIFSGHQHKCLGLKCHVLQPLNEWEVQSMKLNTSMIQKEDDIYKCFPAGATLCGGNANAHPMSLFYMSDHMKSNPLFMKTALFVPEVKTDLQCPVSTIKTFVNHTDNTLLCRRIEISPSSYELGNNSSIPIFWSGSSSFLTFLKVDFHVDKFIVHIHTAEAENEGKLYLDVHNVPNIIYPYHSTEDLASTTVALY